MANCNCRQQLKDFLDEVSFAMDDVVLFLDPHPYNKEALECYQEYKNMREEALLKCKQEGMPMQVEDVQSVDDWTWALQPWPWKGGC